MFLFWEWGCGMTVCSKQFHAPTPLDTPLLRTTVFPPSWKSVSLLLQLNGGLSRASTQLTQLFMPELLLFPILTWFYPKHLPRQSGLLLWTFQMLTSAFLCILTANISSRSCLTDSLTVSRFPWITYYLPFCLIPQPCTTAINPRYYAPSICRWPSNCCPNLKNNAALILSHSWNIWLESPPTLGIPDPTKPFTQDERDGCMTLLLLQKHSDRLIKSGSVFLREAWPSRW